MLDLDFVRARFPALDTPWAFFDNAGGSAPLGTVIDRVVEHMRRRPVQLGASYPRSREASDAVDAGRRAGARLVNAEVHEVTLGSSSTELVRKIASALGGQWSEGDEVIVTNVDHEANVGPWRALESRGVHVREWCCDPGTLELRLADLEPLLNERTRLVAFTHCSNIVGSLHDVEGIVRCIHAAGALACVDGVAAAPHRLVDVRATGVDLYFYSLYKVFGPHAALLYGTPEVLARAAHSAHFFHPDTVPAKFEPGGVVHELVASLPAIGDYLDEVDGHHGGDPDAPERVRWSRAFELFAQHEQELVTPLLAFLDGHPRVRLLGRSAADGTWRVPTVSFTVEGSHASAVPTALEQYELAARFGHFYAYRLVRDLGLLEQGGVVRVSLAHYNTPAEVQRLVEALEVVVGH